MVDDKADFSLPVFACIMLTIFIFIAGIFGLMDAFIFNPAKNEANEAWKEDRRMEMHDRQRCFETTGFYKCERGKK